MTQEDRQLLLADLCSRLPYGVKVLIPECRQDIATLIGADDKCFAVKYGSIFYCPFHISIKPYLRPISSMTEAEKEELRLTYSFIYSDYPFDDEDEDEDSIEGHYEPSVETFDWYNKNMFDYRGLISKGLALEAPEGLYN